MLPKKQNNVPSYNLSQRAHFWSIVTIFTGLGFFVGAWAVLVADLANALKLSPTLLGIALSCFPCTGIVVLMFGGTLADRFTRKHILLVGVAGIGLFLVALAFVYSYPLLLLAILFGGGCASCYDLAVNTIGGDYERHYGSKTMSLFHAGFSAGAAFGALGSALALTASLSFHTIYLLAGVLLLVLGIAVLFLPFPPTGRASTDELASRADRSAARISMARLLIIPFVSLAVALVCLAFFTDGTLEGYLSVYLRDLLGSGPLLGGIGFAVLYLTGLIGKLASAPALRRFGDRAVLTVAGLLSTLGMSVALATHSAPLIVAGLLLVGLGEAPIVPTGFSLAARAGNERGAKAVALVTACGYSVFLVSPLLIGFLAALFSLRAALLLTIATSVGVVLTAQFLPRERRVARSEQKEVQQRSRSPE